jgi:tetratricopeptide (TPR) repeat protein
MSGKKMKMRLKEAEVYYSQGLLAQAREKYTDILETVKTNPESPNQEKFLAYIEKRVHKIREEMEEIDNEGETPRLSEEQQELIKNIFSYSNSKNMAALEGAVALADFGQYEKALIEFQKLLKDEMMPKMIVAKNMLRCHVFLASPQKAMEQIKAWASDDLFSQSELAFLQDFMENLLKEEDIVDFVFNPGMSPLSQQNVDKNPEEVFEIYSVRMQPDHTSRIQSPVDLEVAYQVGNTFRFHIKAANKETLSRLNKGDRFDLIQCYSPSSLFNTSGTISQKTKITSGPSKGDYSIELTIDERSGA